VKKPVVKKRLVRRRGSADEHKTREDLTKVVHERAANVRMRVVVEVDVSEEEFARDTFNEVVIDWARTLENFNAQGDCKIVLLTTEELAVR